MTDIHTLRRILNDYKRVAVVGLSADWSRPSNFAAKYMLDHGFEMIPVNPKYENILGQKCYPDLKSIPGPVDIVDLFQRGRTGTLVCRLTLSKWVQKFCGCSWASLIRRPLIRQRMPAWKW